MVTVDVLEVVFHIWMASIHDFMQKSLCCSNSEKDEELSVLRIEVVGHRPIGSMCIL